MRYRIEINENSPETVNPYLSRLTRRNILHTVVETDEESSYAVIETETQPESMLPGRVTVTLVEEEPEE